MLTGQAWACAGPCSAEWPALVFSTAAHLQEGSGDCQSHSMNWGSWGPPFCDGPPLEKVVVFPLSVSPEHCALGPVQVPWSYPKTTADGPQPLSVWGAVRDGLSDFSWCLVMQWCDLGPQVPGGTLLLLNTSVALWFWSTRDQRSPCCLCVFVDAGMPALLAWSSGDGVVIADRQVSVSRNAWELGCTSTGASTGNLPWFWLHRMHSFSTTAICHYNFGACAQLRRKRVWHHMSLVCLPVSSWVWGLGAGGHHVVVTSALCPDDKCHLDLVMAWAHRGRVVWEQRCTSLWSPGKSWSKISSMAEVALLSGLCNQCLSLLYPMKSRLDRMISAGLCGSSQTSNFAWSVTCSAAGWSCTTCRSDAVKDFLISRFCGQRITADRKRFLAQMPLSDLLLAVC